MEIPLPPRLAPTSGCENSDYKSLMERKKGLNKGNKTEEKENDQKQILIYFSVPGNRTLSYRAQSNMRGGNVSHYTSTDGMLLTSFRLF